jgi:hypothetical protein
MISPTVTPAAERSRTLISYPNAVPAFVAPVGVDATWPVCPPVTNGMRHSSALVSVNARLLTAVIPNTQAGRGVFAGTKQARPPRGVPR